MLCNFQRQIEDLKAALRMCEDHLLEALFLIEHMQVKTDYHRPAKSTNIVSIVIFNIIEILLEIAIYFILKACAVL